MKSKLIILVSAFLIIGCSKFNNEKSLVENSLQSFEGTQLDLNVRFNNFECIKQITNFDSLNYIVPIYASRLKIDASNFEEFKFSSDSLIKYNSILIDSISSRIIELNKLKDKLDKKLNTKFTADNLERMVEIEFLIIDEESVQSSLESDNMVADIQQKILSKYNTNPGTVIGDLFKVNYTAFNPLLNTNQTVGTYYLINLNTDYIKRLDKYGKQ